MSLCLQPAVIGPPQAPPQHHQHWHQRGPAKYCEGTLAAVLDVHSEMPRGSNLHQAADSFLFDELGSLASRETTPSYAKDLLHRNILHCPELVVQAPAVLALQAAQLWVTVCGTCLASLARRTIPPASLVSVDAGSTAVSKHDGQPLPPLTLIESLIVAPLRPMRHVIVCKPADTRQRPNDTFVRALRGHVIAFPNPPARALASCFPCALEDVPDLIQVRLPEL